jgi:integrase
MHAAGDDPDAVRLRGLIVVLWRAGLRHTFVTGLVRAGNDLVLVAELAGHRRLETTRRYSLPSKAGERGWPTAPLAMTGRWRCRAALSTNCAETGWCVPG